MHEFVFRTKDFYHTCYCLSGLSVAQHFADGKHACTRVIGNKEINEVVCIHLYFCIVYPQYAVNVSKRYFQTGPVSLHLGEVLNIDTMQQSS